jgi:ABC-type glycerol-3-phosphate transport system substrate-binding protein
MSPITRFLALAAALLAMAFVAAGCGSSDDSTTSSGGDAEAEITAVLEESVAFEDPATICEENFTEKVLEENYEGKDREARVEDCSKDEPGGLTEIEISSVKVNGDKATAKVSAVPDGEDKPTSFTVELADEDGWKVDGVE